MSKGSARRPRAITAQEEAERWDRTFGYYGRSLVEDPMEGEAEEREETRRRLDILAERMRFDTPRETPDA